MNGNGGAGEPPAVPGNVNDILGGLTTASRVRYDMHARCRVAQW